MRYVSEYQELRETDARDREMRAEMQRDRAEEINYPEPVATVTRTPKPATPRRNPPCPSLARVQFNQEICAYCGEPSRRCECWS